MPRYLVTQTREVVVEAPSASVARTVGTRAFVAAVSPLDLKPGMSISNIQNVVVKVEEVN